MTVSCTASRLVLPYSTVKNFIEKTNVGGVCPRFVRAPSPALAPRASPFTALHTSVSAAARSPTPSPACICGRIAAAQFISAFCCCKPCTHTSQHPHSNPHRPTPVHITLLYSVKVNLKKDFVTVTVTPWPSPARRSRCAPARATYTLYHTHTLVPARPSPLPSPCHTPHTFY